MALNARDSPTVCAFLGPWWHSMSEFIRSCVHFKGYDVMPRLTFSDHVCCWRIMMTCHARTYPRLCAVQGLWWHATLDVVRLSVQSKGDDGMSRSASSYHVYCPRDTLAFHARCCVTVCAVQGRRWHAMRDIIWSCMLSKGEDGMPGSTSSIYVWSPRDIIAFHVRYWPTVCAIQELWWHAMPNVFKPSVLSKGYDGVWRSTLSNRVHFPRSM